MINSKNTFYKIQQHFIVLIASTIFFRPFCSLLIILFAVYNLLHFKFFDWPKKQNFYYIVLLAFPLIFEILFFWNNSSISLGFKSLEKSLSLLVFPLFIVGNYKNLDFFKIANNYRYITTVILSVLLVRFIIFYPDLINNYVNGINLFEMGYKFADSFKNHAPAVNLHVAFIVMANVYFFIKDYNQEKSVNLLFIFLSVFLLFYINTRISLATSIIGCFLIAISFVLNSTVNKTMIFKALTLSTIIIGLVLFIAFKTNPYMKEKYSNVTFAYLDKVGKLDEIENPAAKISNAFVTRLSIWKSAYELGMRQPLIGYGSADGKNELVDYFKETEQEFLAEQEFPAHNQLLDFFIKYGVLGMICMLSYLIYPIIIGYKSKNVLIVCFGMNFFISNMFDDFLVRFDGIIFCAIWFSLLTVYYLKKSFLSESLK